MDDLKGRVAIVTGGGSGIGLAFCKLLYSAGCKILIVDLRLHAQGEAWLSQIAPNDSAESRVSVAQADVTNWNQLEKCFDQALTTFGREPDILVPGAGVYEPSSNSFWADTDTESHYKVLDINLVHPIKASRIAIRRWAENKMPGTILHISSIAGQRSSAVTPLYTASKHGINSFVRGMAPLERLAGIRVVAVAPG
jgi:3-hydroxybutyrate dehydrogenase